MIYIILIISFLLGIYFLLTPLIAMYPYFKNTLLLFIVFGLLFDIIMNTLFINTIIFIIINYLCRKYYNYFKYNIYSSILLTILVLYLYKLLTYLGLFILNDINFNLLDIFDNIKIIIINVIYCIVINIIVKKLLKKTII